MISKRELARRLGVTPWTLMRWVRRGEFPAPLKPSEQTVIWPVSVVEEWQREQLEKAEAERAAKLRKRSRAA
jgi:predicted DNA-binding transcriptional regulator AlpA